MPSLPLFPESGGESHHAVFESWLSAQQENGALRRPSSIAVYRDMWSAFAAWCLGQSPAITLGSLNRSDLSAFQQARFGMKSADLSLSPRYALRLLRLIDRVLHHRAETCGTQVNTAAADWLANQPEVRYADSARADPLPEFLSISEAKHLITYLSGARPRPGASGERQDLGPLTWQALRNRVAVGLQLGAGLAPGDVRSLRLDAPRSQDAGRRARPWKIAVPGNGNSPAREAPVAPWAGELLAHWLKVRAESSIAGEFLFPATRTGKPWSKEAQYVAAKQVLEDAGIEAIGGGSFLLRHTFALRQLRRGAAIDQVARWLGVEVEAMGKYQRVLTAPEDVI
jgi:integrase